MKTKLLYITNEISGPGGLERVLSIKASYLADFMDYEVHILTLNRQNAELFYNFSSNLKLHDIIVSGNPFTYLYRYIKGLRKKVKEIKPDLISVCDDGLKGFFAPLVLGKPCPMVYERHVSKNIEIKNDSQSLTSKLKTKMKFKMMDYGGSLYDSFVVLTKGNLKEWPMVNLHVIPNPLSFYPDNEQISTTLNRRVIAVGKQSYQKGYDRLLQCWQVVVQKHPEWQLDIYGTINKNQGLEALAQELDITNYVNFYAPVKNIAEKYRESSIYVMSSRYEGFGMVLTEAMAYGVPCVSFDCPHGPSDIIVDNENGLLVENDDIEGLATALNYFIENPEERKQMGKKARVSVERYLPETIALEWNVLFKSLIRKDKQ